MLKFLLTLVDVCVLKLVLMFADADGCAETDACADACADVTIARAARVAVCAPFVVEGFCILLMTQSVVHVFRFDLQSSCLVLSCSVLSVCCVCCVCASCLLALCASTPNDAGSEAPALEVCFPPLPPL